MKGKARPAPSGRRRLRGVFLIGAGAAVLVVGGLWGAAYATSDRAMPPHTVIAGIEVGGLPPEQATSTLCAGIAEQAAAPLTLAFGSDTVTKTPEELGLDVDCPASVAQAGGTRTANPVELVEGLLGGRSYPAVTTVDRARLTAQLAELTLSEGAPVDAAVGFDGVTPVVTPGQDGQVVQLTEAADAVVAAYPEAETVALPTATGAPAITTQQAQSVADTVAAAAVAAPVVLTADGAQAALEPAVIAGAVTFVPTDGELTLAVDPAALAERAEKPLRDLGLKAPVNATIKNGSNGPVIADSADGMGLSPEALAEAVRPALAAGADRTVAVTPTVVAPSLSTEDAKKLGVKEVIGEFTTYFPGSAYRYVNIPKGAGMINDTLVLPGETFSLNDALGGQRTTAKGWASGYGIMNGKETIQVGGALSQLTTTLYNAVFFAGLEDVQHKPHSLWFSRYPQGREATLNWPDVDLKFRNDSPYGVLIQAWTTGQTGVQGSVTVRLWSTKVYEVKQANTVISRERSMTDAPTQDSSLDCVAQPAMNGFDIDFDRQFWRDGQLVKSQHYFWRYNTLAPTVCTGSTARPG